MTKMMYAGENMMVVEDVLKRTDGILAKAPLPQSERFEHPQNSSVTFKNVSYRYEGGKQDALHNINLDVKPGEHIALVGPSGGGKSTLAKRIARFADLYEGSVWIGNADVRNMESGELMDTVSFVFQDSRLLKMSILDNVRMGNRKATREQVLEALHEAQCEDILAKFPDGIDTVIGSKGTHLFGGEAQRIAIARAILKDAPILILDEATAFADPDNEAKVQAAFSRLSCGKTVIMIALTTYIQYNATFLSTYVESGVRRITLAEKLRKIPLSFFGKKDLSDLTSTIIADCAMMETASSHFIPELVGACLSTALVAIGLIFFNWRMALAALWVLPVSFAIVLGSSRVQNRLNRKQMEYKMELKV